MPRYEEVTQRTGSLGAFIPLPVVKTKQQPVLRALKRTLVLCTAVAVVRWNVWAARRVVHAG